MKYTEEHRGERHRTLKPTSDDGGTSREEYVIPIEEAEDQYSE